MTQERNGPTALTQEWLACRNERMRELRRAGIPVAEIAIACYLTEGAVRKITAGAVPRDGRNLVKRSPELYKQVVEARAKGFWLKDIATHFNLPLSTVGDVIRRHRTAAKAGARQPRPALEDEL